MANTQGQGKGKTSSYAHATSELEGKGEVLSEDVRREVPVAKARERGVKSRRRTSKKSSE